MVINSTVVGVVQDEEVMQYPSRPPFSPDFEYPEYPFHADHIIPSAQSGQENHVYRLVRQLFAEMRLDASHFDTPQWNPLGGIIRPGDTVLIKPNLVQERHSRGGDIFGVIAHGSIVRAVMDYVWIALRGSGKIVIGDAPLQSANFEKVTRIAGLTGVVAFYQAQGMDVELVDFRKVQTRISIDGVLSSGRPLTGDPSGTVAVNLGDKSRLVPISARYERYRVTCYDPAEMNKHHNLTVNEYLIANSALQADVLINLPKLKTHRKVGLTCALKNLVGLNACKDWLPHHRMGSAAEGGDEYLHVDALKSMRSKFLDRENSSRHWLSRRLYSFSQKALSVISKVIRKDAYSEGSWYGNDTAWRMALDLNSILLYADQNGEMKDKPQRRIFVVVDGIIAGEGEGPLEPTARPAGLLIGGYNPVAVDTVAARLIGFDFRKIPLIREGYQEVAYPLADFSAQEVEVLSNQPRWRNLNAAGGGDNLGFKAPRGWLDHIEL